MVKSLNSDDLILVIAENPDQARRWIKHNVRVITRREQVMGLNDFNYVMVSAWHKSSGCRKIYEEIELRKIHSNKFNERNYTDG